MPNLPHAVTVVVVALVAINVVCVALLLLLRRRGVHVVPRTMFGPALVFDSEDDEGTPIRLLNVNGKFQSVSYTSDELKYRLVCVYHRYFEQVVDIAGLAGGQGRAERALVIGGGGYSFPKWLVSSCPNLRTTVVEIDPKVTELARRFFFLDDLIEDYDAERGGRLELVCGDGWEYLRQSDGRYGLIVNDAFGGKRPLGPLGTEEGARVVGERLAEGGVYLANVIAPLEGRGSDALRGPVEACKDVFEHVYLIPEAPESPQLTGDNVLVASHSRLAIAREYVVR